MSTTPLRRSVARRGPPDAVSVRSRRAITNCLRRTIRAFLRKRARLTSVLIDSGRGYYLTECWLREAILAVTCQARFSLDTRLHFSSSSGSATPKWGSPKAWHHHKHERSARSRGRQVRALAAQYIRTTASSTPFHAQRRSKPQHISRVVAVVWQQSIPARSARCCGSCEGNCSAALPTRRRGHPQPKKVPGPPRPRQIGGRRVRINTSARLDGGELGLGVGVGP